MAPTTTPFSAEVIDPFTQTIVLVSANNITTYSIPLNALDSRIKQWYSLCISHGVQFGLLTGMFFAMLLLTPADRLIKRSAILQLITIVCDMVRQLLMTLYFTSGWTELYSNISGDWAHITATDMGKTLSTNAMTMVVFIMIQVLFGLHAWTMVKLWSPIFKWCVLVLSTLISVTAIVFKFAMIYLYSKAAYDKELVSVNAQWYDMRAYATNAASMAWFAAVFNSQLVIHLVRTRRILPSRHNLTPMEALVITNGILMAIPVTFAFMSHLDFSYYFDVVTWSITSSICVLSYGSLAAQRIANSPVSTLANISAGSGNSHSNNIRNPFYNMPRNSTTRLTDRRGSDHIHGTSTVMAHIESGNSLSPLVNSHDVEIGTVRVDRDVDQKSEKQT